MEWYGKPEYKFVRDTFSTRTAGCLINTGLLSLEQIADRTEKDLLAISNLGRRSLNEIKEVLFAHGLELSSGKPNDPELLALVELAKQTRAALDKASGEHGAVMAKIKKRREQLGI